MIPHTICTTVLCAFAGLLLQDSRAEHELATHVSARADGSAVALSIRAEVRAPERFVLEKGEHDIVDLIEKSGEFLGRRYLLDKSQDPALCQTNATGNKVTIAQTIELDAEGTEDFVGQILFSKGWVATPLDKDTGLYDWILTTGPRGVQLRSRAVTVSVEDLLARPKKVEYVRCVVRLENNSAQIAAANLRQVYNDPRGLLSILSINQRDVLVSGFRHSVAPLLALLRAADTAGAGAPSLSERVQTLEERVLQLESRGAPTRKRG